MRNPLPPLWRVLIDPNDRQLSKRRFDGRIAAPIVAMLAVIFWLAVIAAAVVALAGCTGEHGPRLLPGDLDLGASGRLVAYDVMTADGPFRSTHGIGVILASKNGSTLTPMGWALATGPNATGFALATILGAGAVLGGAGIISAATSSGLSDVSGAVGAQHFTLSPPVRP